jgi:DNA-damage-inducible protein J
MAQVTIQVGDELKQQAETVLEDIGMTLSAATAVFLRQIVLHNGIPFELKADPFYAWENRERLRSAARRMEETGGTVHEILEDD